MFLSTKIKLFNQGNNKFTINVSAHSLKLNRDGELICLFQYESYGYFYSKLYYIRTKELVDKEYFLDYFFDFFCGQKLSRSSTIHFQYCPN